MARKTHTREELIESAEQMSAALQKRLPPGNTVAFGLIVFDVTDGNLFMGTNCKSQALLAKAFSAAAETITGKLEVRKNPPKARG